LKKRPAGNGLGVFLILRPCFLISTKNDALCVKNQKNLAFVRETRISVNKDEEIIYAFTEKRQKSPLPPISFFSRKTS